MVGDLCNASLSMLSSESRNLLSALLNTKKALPSVGPDKLIRHRDYRGLASLANISNECLLCIDNNNCIDKTAKVIEVWMERNDGSATVGRLLQILACIDRYDVYDDLVDLARRDKLIAKPINPSICNQVSVGVAVEDTDEDIITFDDKKFGRPQRYHAYVLFAREDKDFVDELLTQTRQQGFKICTEDELLPGHSTKFEPVARLISERCRHIILVYSPDFLNSPAINFCTNLAQADGITKKQLKIIPIMYRECVLPYHLRCYHNLRYSRPEDKAPYNFWQKLYHTLETTNLPRLNSTISTHSELKIAQVSTALSNRFTPTKAYPNGQIQMTELVVPNGRTQSSGLVVPNGRTQSSGLVVPNNRMQSTSLDFPNLLALPKVPTQSVSLGDLRVRDPSPTTRSLSQSSDDSKKKGNPVRKLLSTLSRKKKKLKAVVVVDN